VKMFNNRCKTRP